MLDNRELKKLGEQFEEEGEEKVSADLALGRFGVVDDPTYPKACFAKVWLEKKKVQREETKKQAELQLAEEANRIAKESNEISKSAKNAAWWAFWISIVSITVSFLVAVFKK